MYTITEFTGLEQRRIENILDLITDQNVKTELQRRLQLKEPSPVVTSPAELFQQCKDIADHTREHFKIVVMDTRNRILKNEVLFIGTINSASYSVRDIIKSILDVNGVAFAVAHNHPSGDAAPSPEDVNATRDIKNAAELMGLDFLDHIIVGANGSFTSLRERRLGWD